MKTKPVIITIAGILVLVACIFFFTKGKDKKVEGVAPIEL